MSHLNLEVLKAHIVKTWETMNPTNITKTCESLHPLVGKVIAAEGVTSSENGAKVCEFMWQTSVWCLGSTYMLKLNLFVEMRKCA